jgi:hypothetical protein
MNASRAKRRWMAWCRYVAATGTQADRSRAGGTDIHTGQVKAYQGHMFARRSYPRGVRVPYYPKWGSVRRG